MFYDYFQSNEMRLLLIAVVDGGEEEEVSIKTALIDGNRGCLLLASSFCMLIKKLFKHNISSLRERMQILKKRES
jgi:hypothetical protein